MSQLNETEDIFFGRLAWAGAIEWARDNNAANGEWFRAWEELSDNEKTRYARIGMGIATYFRNTEGNEVLQREVEYLQNKYDAAMSTARKEHKDRGGR